MGRKLYVGNIPYETNEQDLQDLFAQAGTVETITVMRDRDTGRARGFAFVEMANDDAAQKAITDLNGADRNSARVVNADCHVEVVEPAGADTYVVTRLGGREVIGRMRSDMQVAPHSTVPFAFNMDKAVYFDPQSELRIA